MAKTIDIKIGPNKELAYPKTHEAQVIDGNGGNLQTKMADVQSRLTVVEDEVAAVDRGEMVVTWDGASAPTVANIPAGVTVTYDETDYTGTLAASSTTMGPVYLVPDENGNADRYVVSLSGTTYSWVKIGSLEMDISSLATKSELGALDQKVDGLQTFTLDASTVWDKKEGFVINVNGALGANASYNVYVFNVEDFMKIIGSGPSHIIGSGSSYVNYPVVAFYNGTPSNTTLISSILEDVSYQAKDFSTDVPAGTKYIAVAQYTNRDTPTAILSKTISLKDSISALQQEDTALDEKFDQKTIGSTADKITSENTGKYIGQQGTLANSDTFAYSSQFYAEAGSTITIKGRGYLTYVSMIAKVVVEGSSYTPLVMSTDSNVHTYEYKVTESGYYACSWGIAEPHEIYVYKNTPEKLAGRIEALEVFEANIGDRFDAITESTLTIETKETGKFISVNGQPASSDNFSYSKSVFIKGGSLIIVNARGYLTYVAIIAKAVDDGVKYITVAPSIDSTLRQYSYLVPEDGFYAFSWNTAAGITAKIVLYPVLDGYRIQENLYCGVPSVGIIGDSLASGAGYDPNTNGVHDNIQYAWWKVFERKSGMTYRRFCAGGMSTRNFITDVTYGLPAALTEGNQCKLYIIGLEINDRAIGASYLGQESDIDMSDPDNNADTYYGNYARIIQKITAFNAGCKFILFTNPRTDGDFNDAIRVISRKFQNCFLVDLWALYSEHFVAGGFYSNYQDQSAHYPALAYQSMANLFARAIDDCINDNRADFVNIQY